MQDDKYKNLVFTGDTGLYPIKRDENGKTVKYGGNGPYKDEPQVDNKEQVTITINNL